MSDEKKKAVLIAFSVNSQKFESVSERGKFFKSLYGWKQMVRKEVVDHKGKRNVQKGEKVYTYHREGVLDEVPHVKVDQSSFIVPEDEFRKIFRFMKEWHDKVMFKSFKILLEDKNILKAFEDFDEEEEEAEENVEEEV